MFGSLLPSRAKPQPVRLRHRFGAQALEFYQEGASDLYSPWWRQGGLKWDEHDLGRVRLLRQLEDDESVISADQVLYLPHDHWDRLEADEQLGLGVAKPFDFAGKLVAVGDAGTEKFSIRLDFLDGQREQLELSERNGPFLRCNHSRYYLNPAQRQLFEMVDAAREWLTPRDMQARLMAMGRLLAAAAAAGVPADPYLASQQVVSPQTILPLVKVGVEADTLEVTPGFDGQEPDAKFQRQLDSGDAIKGIYQYNREDGTSARVLLSEPIQEAVEQLREVRKLKGNQRRRFLDAPEEFLSHPAFDLTDFGDRVVGIVAQRVRFYPQIPSSETEWVPTIALKIEDECGLNDPWELVVDAKDVGQMLTELRTAQQDNISTFEFKGMDFPATPVIERKLEELGKRLQPPADHEAKTPETKAPRLELEIKENIESLEYQQVSGEMAAVSFELDRPASLKPEIDLLPHQREGVAWLQGLYRNPGAQGALLADDMGLGKTIQLWTLLEWIRLQNDPPKPSLIVCPVSLIHNWEDEYHKFFGGKDALPHYAFAKLHGDNTRQHLKGKHLDLDKLERYPYVLTSYETLRQYHLDLPRVDWACVVLDESQKIKSPATQVTRAAKALKADFRVASTGTPVENHLSELWCIVDFVEPGRLGCLKDFLKEFPADPTQAEDLTEKIQERCGALLKRRLKSQISQGLPSKTPSSPRVDMSPLQQQQYRSALAQGRKQDGTAPAMLSLLQGLRKLCAFHQGADLCPDVDSLRKESAKFAWLLKTLDEIKKRHEKVILFIELREFQRLLAHWLGEKYGLSIRTINGEVSTSREKEGSRHQILREFNEQAGFQILILSPLAAGVGLTITCANHVIHFMRHWNPAKEDQATDRAYRIGQTKEVFVYYPLCVHPEFKTFDEGLHDLLERKREQATRALFPSLYGEVRPDEVWGSLIAQTSNAGKKSL